MQGDNVRVNKVGLCWGSLVAKVDGDPLRGFTEINYEESLDPALGYGMGAHQAPRSRSRGQYNPGKVGVIGFSTSVVALKKALAKAGGGRSYGLQEFQLILSAVEEDETPITTEIYRCRIVKVKAPHKVGPELFTQEIELSVMKIVENGLTLYDSDTDPVPV